MNFYLLVNFPLVDIEKILSHARELSEITIYNNENLNKKLALNLKRNACRLSSQLLKNNYYYSLPKKSKNKII